MPTIATLNQLKEELGLETTTGHDNRLILKLEISEALCLNHIKQRLGDVDEAADWSDEVDSWDEDSAPREVLGAILKMACHLYRDTGDLHPDDAPTTYPNELPRDVTALLARYRDPGLA